MMTLKQFRKLKHRDFTNGAVLDEIEITLEAFEKSPQVSDGRLFRLCNELDMEMDGVQVPATAAAILNAIRSELHSISRD